MSHVKCSVLLLIYFFPNKYSQYRPLVRENAILIMSYLLNAM